MEQLKLRAANRMEVRYEERFITMALFLNWSLSDQVRPFTWTSASTTTKRQQEVLNKHSSASADLLARPPSINDVVSVFLDNEEGALLLGANKSGTAPAIMFEDAVVGRVACNGSNTTSFAASWLDCYGGNYSYLTGNATMGNGTGLGGGAGADEALTDVILMGVTSVVLGLMILVTVIGNVFVIAAILLERNLQNVANYLIVSLAVADLMVACLVMPLGAVYEISKGWILGPELCDMWTSSDVLCCTASILHLVAIAVDRYWAVTNVDYIHTRNGNRIGAMIVVVWAVALIVSLAPQFGWKDPEYLDRINKQQRCLPSQDVGYQIFATCSTFYVPLLVILVLYWKIFQTARKRIHRRQRPRPPPTAPSQVSQQTSNNTPSLQQTGPPGTRAVSRFITKRRFRRITSSSSKKKKSSAAEALVSSLVMVEGGHSTSTSVQDVGAVCDDDVANSCGPGPKTSATSEEDEEEPAPGEATTAFTISRSLEGGGTTATTSNNVSPEKSSTATTTNNGSASHQSHISDMSRVEILHRDNPPPSTTPASARGVGGVKERLLLAAAAAAGGGAAGAAAACHMQRRDKKESLEAKRERKAAKTLAIITGAFVVCWLPFFIMALLMPLCSACVINDYMASFFLWLGYFNSTLNPVIYTIFSPEFRQAFKRILCGAAGSGRSRNFRPGKLR